MIEFYDREPIWSSKLLVSPKLTIWKGDVISLDGLKIRFRIGITVITIEKGKLVERQGRKVTDLSYR